MNRLVVCLSWLALFLGAAVAFQAAPVMRTKKCAVKMSYHDVYQQYTPRSSAKKGKAWTNEVEQEKNLYSKVKFSAVL